MKKIKLNSKQAPVLIALFLMLFFAFSYCRGNNLVKISEKELNSINQSDEAQASSYSMREVDAKTGQVRWELFAKEGKTESNLKGALIKEITAKVFKENKVVFKLSAPFGKADSASKSILLFGDVIASDEKGDLNLKSKQIALGMGTSIEAQNGFSLILKDTGTVVGERALINDEQTEIIVTDLKEAAFKDIILSGSKVNIEKDGSELKTAYISNGGKVILKKEKESSVLTADVIKWKKNGEVEAISNVEYKSGDKIFKAGYLIIKEGGEIYAKNNVLIEHGTTKCYGGALSYENASEILISGKPKAVQGNSEIRADKILYNIDTGKVQALGNVRTTVSQKA